MVSPHERRRAERVECKIPVLLKAGGRSFHAVTEDISRIGVLLNIRLSELGLGSDDSLSRIAHEVTHALGDVVIAHFHYEQLGPLVRKAIRLVRVGRTDVKGDSVEVGCALRTPLTEEQVGFLGVPLPEAAVRAASEEPHFIEPRAGETAGITKSENGVAAPQAPLHVVLCSSIHGGASPLMAVAQQFRVDGVNANVADLRALPVLPERRDVGALLKTLAETYGSEPMVILMRGLRPLWSGSARILAVDVPTDADGFVLQLGFLRPCGIAMTSRAGSV